MDLVSVIIPVYNREETVEKAIDSVLNQTYDNLEVIVVDDCSSDNSVEVVKKIEDPRVKLIECQENAGACKARNIGIDNAKGDYIAFHDSDDLWHKDKLEKSLYYLKKENADFVFSALYRKKVTEEENNNTIIPNYDINKFNNQLAKILAKNCVSTQTIVVKKKVLEKVRFDIELPRFQDWDFSIQVIEKGFAVYYIDEPLVDCYILSDSITSNDVKGYRALKYLENKYQRYYKKYPEAYKEFCEGAAYFYEMSGKSGADYYFKAYKIEPTFKNHVRYLVSKVGLFRLWVRIFG